MESEARGWPLVFTFTGVEVMSSSPTRNFHTNFFLFFSLPQEKKKRFVLCFSIAISGSADNLITYCFSTF